MDRLPVGLNDMLANGQSETGTAFIPAPGGIGAIESLEYP
jgi:hypothetical protein